jgi:co-chaperonin GroES (HSP10)
MRFLQGIKDKVIVEVISPESVTDGGLFIPESAIENDPHRRGRVISCGDEVIGIVPGDTVMFHRNGGQATALDGKQYKVLMFGEIFCTIKESSH